MNILVVADIYGEFDLLNKVYEETKNENIDVVVCPGNFTDMFTNTWDIDQLDVIDIIIQKLLLYKKPVFCVPGNHDPYESLSVFSEYGVDLHAKKSQIGGMTFVGFGGAQTPFNTAFEPTETEIQKALKHLGGDKNTILITHNPPKNTTLDKLKDGNHVGSESIRGYIEEKKPLLGLHAHIHEGAGEDKINKSVLFNPGPLVEGNYGIVTITPEKTTCQRKKITLPKTNMETS